MLDIATMCIRIGGIRERLIARCALRRPLAVVTTKILARPSYDHLSRWGRRHSANAIRLIGCESRDRMGWRMLLRFAAYRLPGSDRKPAGRVRFKRKTFTEVATLSLIMKVFYQIQNSKRQGFVQPNLARLKSFVWSRQFGWFRTFQTTLNIQHCTPYSSCIEDFTVSLHWV